MTTRLFLAMKEMPSDTRIKAMEDYAQEQFGVPIKSRLTLDTSEIEQVHVRDQLDAHLRDFPGGILLVMEQDDLE